MHKRKERISKFNVRSTELSDRPHVCPLYCVHVLLYNPYNNLTSNIEYTHGHMHMHV